MKTKTLFTFGVTLFYACAPYPVKIVQKKIGIKLQNDTKLCSASLTQDQKCCQPYKDWAKASDWQPISVEDNKDSLKVLKRVATNFIFQGTKKSKIFVFHSQDIIGDDRLNNDGQGKNDYINTGSTKISIAQIYEKIAINQAKSILNAKIEELKISAIDAQVYTHFETELKKQIQTNYKNSAQLEYIVISLNGIQIPLSDWKEFKPALDKFNTGKYDLITGISGFIISNYQSTTTIFEDIWCQMALDASIKGAIPADQYATIKASVSVEWSQKVNEKISTEINYVSTNPVFYPLWIQKVNVKNIDVYSFKII